MSSSKKAFKRIYVEISNVCNLSCRFCPPLERAPKSMSTEEFSRICTAINTYTDYIYMHLMGEPLLHPKLSELMAIAHDNGLKVQLTTNGTLIGERSDHLLDFPALRQVNFSLSSYEANAIKMGLKDYLEPIIQFSKKASEKGQPYISLRLWNLDSETLKGENELNELFFQHLTERFNYAGNLADYLIDHDSCQLIKGVYLNKAKKFSWPDKSLNPSGEALYCYGLKDHIGILADGTVVPCCLDHAGAIPLGNIFEKSLESILASQRAENMRQGFANRRASEHLCKTCGYATRF